jgi:hypothetical protein
MQSVPQVFRRMFLPTTALAVVALVIAGALVVLLRPGSVVHPTLVAVVWGIALLAGLLVVAFGAAPARGIALLIDVIALIATGTFFGAVHGSAAGLPAALAMLVFLLVATGVTVLRADSAGAPTR